MIMIRSASIKQTSKICLIESALKNLRSLGYPSLLCLVFVHDRDVLLTPALVAGQDPAIDTLVDVSRVPSLATFEFSLKCIVRVECRVPADVIRIRRHRA